MQYWNVENPPLEQWKNELPAMGLIAIVDEYHFSKKKSLSALPNIQVFQYAKVFDCAPPWRIISDPRHRALRLVHRKSYITLWGRAKFSWLK